MHFSRHGQSDDRRRRLLTESAVFAADDSASSGSDAGKSGNANNPSRLERAALMESLPRISDLIPRRVSTLLLLWLSGVAVIGGLEALYWRMPSIAPLATDGTVEAIDLDGEGTLAVWFSTFTLTLACLVTLVIYAIRKRQVDDYRARYRVWLWAALCWLVLGMDETASLHEGFKEMMTILSGTRLAGDGSLWWAIAWLSVLLPVGFSMLLDMRGSWLARLSLAATGGCYAAAVAVQLGWVPGWHGHHGIMLEEGCEMAGNWMLLFGMVLHARCLLARLEDPAASREPAAKKSASKKESAAKTASAKTKESTQQETAKSKPAEKPQEKETVEAAKSGSGDANRRYDDPEDLLEERGQKYKSRKKKKRRRRL